jgi:hypothetical protein
VAATTAQRVLKHNTVQEVTFDCTISHNSQHNNYMSAPSFQPNNADSLMYLQNQSSGQGPQLPFPTTLAKTLSTRHMMMDSSSAHSHHTLRAPTTESSSSMNGSVRFSPSSYCERVYGGQELEDELTRMSVVAHAHAKRGQDNPNPSVPHYPWAANGSSSFSSSFSSSSFSVDEQQHAPHRRLGNLPQGNNSQWTACSSGSFASFMIPSENGSRNCSCFNLTDSTENDDRGYLANYKW